jgi:hypothetical protein
MALLSDAVVLTLRDGLVLADAASASDQPNVTYAIGADGSLWSADHVAGSAERLGGLDLPPLPEGQVWNGRVPRHRLHVSSSGRFVAVGVDYGRTGVVFDIEAGAVTVALECGAYHEETVPFSAAFVSHKGRDVLIHRTEWNRLDAIDPRTGKVLTKRRPTSYSRQEKRPEHYLDYFHGGLSVSPDGRLILDDGWVWSPVGVPDVWSVEAWLGSNRWESEDGPTKRSGRGGYGWDEGACWLDDDRFVVQGFGGCEVQPPPGVAVILYSDLLRLESRLGDFDGELVRGIPGPEGRLLGHDDLLFAVTPDGLTAWDVASGSVIEACPGFSPSVHSRGGRRLTEVRGDSLVSRVY